MDKGDYLLTMEPRLINDVEIRELLRVAVADRIDDRDVSMKGIAASYHFEGCNAFAMDELDEPGR